jgi:hypothetical protein
MSRNKAVPNPDISTGRYAHEYASFAAAIDLRTDENGPANGECPREWIVLAAAASEEINVKLANGTAKTFSADLIVGIPMAFAIQSIEISTITGSVLVIW